MAIWAHEDPVLVYLTIEGETIVTTPEHPFYTAKGEWVPVADLQPGVEIRAAAWGSGTVEKVGFSLRPQVMYNFTVAQAHTYFVGVGQSLVHNHCGGRHSQILRNNYVARYGASSVPSGAALHHIIPDAVWNHPLVNMATGAGWDNDAWYNGFVMQNPHGTVGFGAHPDYNAYVTGLLDQAYTVIQKNGWGPNEAAWYLQEIRNHLYNGLTDLSYGTQLP